MTNPQKFPIFPAGQAADLTVALPDGAQAGKAILQFVTAGFSGTLDFQGRPYSGAQWTNLPYRALNSPAATVTDQLSLTTSTATLTYVITTPMSEMRVVMTRSAGTIIGYGQYSEFVAGTTGTAGDVAAGATDSGYPVKVAGKYNSTPPPLTDGQRGDVQLDAKGSINVNLRNTNLGAALDSNLNADGVATTVAVLRTLGAAYHFNGATWDRTRGNVASTALASAARTASTPTPDQINFNGPGAKVFLDITGTPNNTETLQLTLEEKDPASNKYVQIAAFTALTSSALGASPTAETYLYEIGSGIAETIAVAKHEIQALLLSRTWRVNVLHSAAGSWTYSVGIVTLV